jgi:spore cortex biosynthesis protein YabQ
VSIHVQLMTMALMVGCGMAMGLLYDTYRVMKVQTKIYGWMVILCDLLFWASCTFLVFGTLLRVNDGIFRIYLFIGMGFGAWLYFALFHTFYIKWFLRFVTLVKAIYQFFVRVIHIFIIKPIIFFYKVIVAIVVWVALFVWKIALLIYHLLCKLFIPFGKTTKKYSKNVYAKIKKKAAGILNRLAKIFRKKRKE